MQWLLTLFATCLPKSAVFRVWDSLMLEGSEILLRSALAIWAKIGRRASRAKTADEFYGLMGPLCQELLRMNPSESNDLMQVIYSMAEFPYPGLDCLRERYTWNIQPFSSTFKLLRQQVASILNSDAEDSSDSEKNNKCLPGLIQAGEKICGSSRGPASAADLGNLQKQYNLMKQRQKQAAVILQSIKEDYAYERGQRRLAPKQAMNFNGCPPVQPEIFNHLYVGKTPPQGTFGTMNGTIPVASKAVQPTGQRRDEMREILGWNWRNRRSYTNSSSQSTATPDVSLSLGGSGTLVESWMSEFSTPTASQQLSPVNDCGDTFHSLSSSTSFIFRTAGGTEKEKCVSIRQDL